MQLLSFRVQNFRSMVDSGALELGTLTAILGEHGAGKSNLLQALASLNPVGGMRDLIPWLDASVWTMQAPRIETLWALDASETHQLAEILGEKIVRIRVWRGLEAMWHVQCLLASEKVFALKTAALVQQVRLWLAQHLPKFWYLARADRVTGYVNWCELLAADQVRADDLLFLQLCEILGFAPEDLMTAPPAQRQMVLSRADHILNQRWLKYWTEHRIRLVLDGAHFAIHFVDVKTQLSLPLGEQSQTLQVFFTLWLSFLAQKQGSMFVLLDGVDAAWAFGVRANFLRFLADHAQPAVMVSAAPLAEASQAYRLSFAPEIGSRAQQMTPKMQNCPPETQNSSPEIENCPPEISESATSATWQEVEAYVEAQQALPFSRFLDVLCQQAPQWTAHQPQLSAYLRIQISQCFPKNKYKIGAIVNYFNKIAQLFSASAGKNEDALSLQKALLAHAWHYFSDQEAVVKESEFLQAMNARFWDSTPFLTIVQKRKQIASKMQAPSLSIPVAHRKNMVVLLEFLLKRAPFLAGTPNLEASLSQSILELCPQTSQKIGVLYSALIKIPTLFARAKLTELAAQHLQTALFERMMQQAKLQQWQEAQAFFKPLNRQVRHLLPLIEARLEHWQHPQVSLGTAAPAAGQRLLVMDTSALMNRADILDFLTSKELAIIPKRVWQELHGLKKNEKAKTVAQACAAVAALNKHQDRIYRDDGCHVALLPLNFDASIPDNEILASALFYHRDYEMTFLSRDMEMLRKARLLQLPVQHSEQWYATREQIQ